MHQQVSPAASTLIPMFSQESTDHVRLVYENPSSEYGWSYFFGVRESFARTLNRLVTVEQYAVERGEAGTFAEVVGAFFERASTVRESLKSGICVYWVILRLTIPRENDEATLMHTVACTVFSPGKTLASMFDTVMREPDDEELAQLNSCSTSCAGIMPVVIGTEAEQSIARSLMETVHRGLMTGYELAFPDIIDPRLKQKPN